MRIHTDLTWSQIWDIIRDAKCGAYQTTLTEHGSRTAKARGIELKLAGTSTRYSNSGQWGAQNWDGHMAATWDEWGIVLAAIFDADPTAIMGSAKHPDYADRDDYHWQTGDRFRWLTSSSDDRYHAHHTFRWAEGMPQGETRCKCGAIRRWGKAEHGAGHVIPSIRTTRARRYVGENLAPGNLVESRTGDLWRITKVDDKAAETLGHDDRGRTVCAPWVDAYPVLDPERAEAAMMASYFVTPAVSYPETKGA